MKRKHLVPALLLAAGCSGGGEPEPEAAPDEITLNIAKAEVAAAPAVVEYLMDRPGLTGSLMRAFSWSSWDLGTDPKYNGLVHVLPPGGKPLWLKPTGRWTYETEGHFHGGMLSSETSRVRLEVRVVPHEGGVTMEATAWLSVKVEGYTRRVRVTRSLLEDKAKAELGYIVRATERVAKEAVKRPDWLLAQLDGSSRVDGAALKELCRLSRGAK